MKRPILLYLVAAFSTLTAISYASTQVPASISTDTNWDASGNPYLVQGKVTVAKGATLHIGPNVQVLFKGAAALEVNGTLNVEGSAAAPAVFNMSEGALNSELFINGAEALLTNVRFVSGVFLVQDSQLHLQWFEVTKGSGLYLRGNTSANIKNGKLYGNAAGVVLDGSVKATLEFDTITQNTYGLFLKSYANLDFTNNSVHDNDKDVVNQGAPAGLGGNYWGNMDKKTVLAKTQGKVDVWPLKSLKDILRVYVRTQLPVITKSMETALKEKEKREQGTQTAKNPPSAPSAPVEAAAPAPAVEAPAPVAEAPAAEVPAPAAEAAAPAPTPEVIEAAPAEVPSAPSGVANVKELPAAAHKLKPLNLPKDQGNVAAAAAGAPPASSESAPAETAPSAATVETIAPPSNDTSAPPVPAEVSGTAPSSDNSATLSAPAAPPQIDVVAPPDIETTTAPPAPPVPKSAEAPAPSSNEGVPAPPDLNEQVPPSATAATAAPSAPAPAAPAPAQPAPQVSTEDQQKAVDSLDGVSGDIDGMQAPPLDLGLDLTPSNGSSTTDATKKSDKTGLTLPPMKDADVAPPKDLDLPPTDDLGNVNIDSKK